MSDNKVVIGSGLLAKLFAGVQFENNILIFASGVSNSLETRVEEFVREEKLVKASMESYPNHLFVYFSSIDNGSNCIQEYLRHKKDMELLITSNASNYLIVRLPAVADPRNKNILLSRIYKAFKTENALAINSAAQRKFVLPADIVRFVCVATQERTSNIVVDLCPDESISVEKLVKKMAIYLDCPMLNLKRFYSAENYHFNNSEAKRLLSAKDAMFKDGYNEQCISYFIKGCRQS